MGYDLMSPEQSHEAQVEREEHQKNRELAASASAESVRSLGDEFEQIAEDITDPVSTSTDTCGLLQQKSTPQHCKSDN
jgi:hypothetical protein